MLQHLRRAYGALTPRRTCSLSVKPQKLAKELEDKATLYAISAKDGADLRCKGR